MEKIFLTTPNNVDLIRTFVGSKNYIYFILGENQDEEFNNSNETSICENSHLSHLPRFDMSIPQNVSATLGKIAILTCAIKNWMPPYEVRDQNN